MEQKEFINLKEITQSGKVVVVYSAQWCGECKMSKILIDKKETEFSDIKFYEIDVDQNKLWENENLEIKQVPTFHFYKDGEIVQKESNYIFEDKLDSILKSL